MNIIGISAHYHDSACCLLQDGVLTAAAQEERFTRVKNDPSLPRQAFRYCLEEAGLSIADVDCVAYYEDPLKKLGRHIWMKMSPGLSQARRAGLVRRLAAGSPIDELREVLGFEGRVETMDHHFAHAASSYHFSGFPDAAIFTVDGVGEWSTTTYGRGRGAQIEIFEDVQFPHSLGLLYSTITAYLGFEVNEGEYKVMGLAPYGKGTHVAELRKLIELGSDGQFRLNMDYFDFLTTDRMFSDALVALIGPPARVPESDIEQVHKDIAKSLQIVLEEILLAKVRHLYDKAPSENLCMAGGVALNCVANGKILREGPFERLFVQPAAGDAGSALGAAAAAHVRLGGVMPRKRLMHVYLGPSYSANEVRRVLGASSVRAQDFRGRERDLIAATAERLAEGKIIGWVSGRMEFGPRSLGARSILADPRSPEMRDKINALVKQREAFRPFAPVVLASHAAEHFELDHASPFMLETCQVRSSLDLPAITHVDGSARVQTVDVESHPRLVALLEEFYRLTGCPILLNTSFNVRGEPIVCRPEDSLLCFHRSRLDTLVLEDFIIDSSDLPKFWNVSSTVVRQARDGIARDVYTLL
jgi:carbamoyltransferase